MNTAIDPHLDQMRLSSNPKFMRMIGLDANSQHGQKMAKWTTVEHMEFIHFSDLVTKINSKGKAQTRVIVVTNKAVYNLQVWPLAPGPAPCVVCLACMMTARH